jgi:predicted helicase
MAADRRRHDSIFKLFSLGVVTNRDDWMYATDDPTLTKKVAHFIGVYNREVSRVGGKTVNPETLTAEIKWTRAVKKDLARGVRYQFSSGAIDPVFSDLS